MFKQRITLVLLAAVLLSGAVVSYGQTVVPASKQDELIAVLKSADATRKDKADACRLLSFIATKKSVPALALLLADEELNHVARYALEPIADSAVDDALRDALGKLKGRPLVGVIGSVGVRRDANAVKALTEMLQEPDAEVAQAAARSLGNIANQPATRALQRALQDAPVANRLALCEGLLRCAETLGSQGQRHAAIEIYDQLRSLKAPHQVRGGALRGAILTRGKDGVALLREHLRSKDYILFSAAVQAALELPGKEVTKALTAELNRLPADNQILVIWTLGKRGDAGALEALFGLAKKGDKSIRLEAIRAMPMIGDESAVPVLVELLGDSDDEVSRTAQDALAALPGQEADAAVTAMLESSEASRRLTALELIGRRRMTKSIPALLKAAQDTDTKVRSAAIKMVGELGNPAELPALLDLLMDLRGPQEMSAAEQALKALIGKAGNPQSYTGKLTGLLTKSQPAQKGVLLRLLSVIGGPNALRVVRAAVNDPSAEVRSAAIRALCGWKSADAAPDLLALASNSKNPSHKTAALRGYIGLVRDESLATNKKLAMCKEAAVLVQRNEEKKLLLGALATVPAAEALSMAMAHLDNPATKDEASFAAVAISEKIVQQNSGEVASALQKVIRATDNKDVLRRARATLNKAKSKVKSKAKKPAGR